MKPFTPNTNTYAVPIKGYEGRYEVTTDGKVISLPKKRLGGNVAPMNKIALSADIKNKYAQVWLYDGSGGRDRLLVHRVVAEHFIPNPNGFECVNHIDRNHLNNDSANLEWVSVQRNNEHAHAKYYNLTSPSGELVTVYNLNRFCLDNNLNQGNMSQVVNGNYLSYKGWRSADHNRVNKKVSEFELLSPSGVCHKVVNSAEFCKSHGLSPSKISLVRNGKAAAHKGWTSKNKQPNNREDK